MGTKIISDIYAVVTNRIIEKLEQGIIPWQQPWKDAGAPRNLITQRLYRGVNYLLLNSLGYPRNEFLTFNQVQDLGARIKKGEKAHIVIYWVWIEDTDGGENRKRPILRYYTVFNESQCTGIPLRAFPPQKINDPIETCEAIVAQMPNCPEIVHRYNEAYYDTSKDYINMPLMQAFESSQEYYATLFHELIHSTGHATRLCRREVIEDTKFGSELYSTEELTAEIGACYLASYAGIVHNNLGNNIAYIQGWLKQLKADKKSVVYASANAQKAVSYILNIKSHENEIAVEHKVNEYEKVS